MHHFIRLAEDAASNNSFWTPQTTWITGGIAIAIFILLAVVTWSYRDVANRHDHKADNHHAGH
jgi:heme/copper-type cytochrome/quinol oxidase subunit 2